MNTMTSKTHSESRTRNSCGWVVRHSMTTTTGQIVNSWWCGPSSSWGTSFGPLLDELTGTLSMSVAVFSTRRDARSAMLSVGLVGCIPVRLDIGIDEVLNNKAAA